VKRCRSENVLICSGSKNQETPIREEEERNKNRTFSFETDGVHPSEKNFKLKLESSPGTKWWQAITSSEGKEEEKRREV